MLLLFGLLPRASMRMMNNPTPPTRLLMVGTPVVDLLFLAKLCRVFCHFSHFWAIGLSYGTEARRFVWWKMVNSM